MIDKKKSTKSLDIQTDKAMEKDSNSPDEYWEREYTHTNISHLY